MRVPIAAMLCLLVASCQARAQTRPASNPPPSGFVFNDQRILGLIPNYQAVSDPNAKVAPLTVKQKWALAARETFDPFNIASAGFGAAFSQSADDVPNYGRGPAAFAKRFGAAVGDFGSQNFFSAGLFASLLHQDPRYFRRGPRAGILSRVGYAVSRVVIARQDSGRTAFNYSGIFGMSLGIAASNLYYPANSINGSVVASRFGTSMMGGAIGNLLSEFWPDLRQRFFHHKHPLG
ncbi:MAG TPA: hypothetical protein VFA33_14270 [Bryobacteraceae bacterium]|nr:hypothetical protein [Bryobacteraceae bacterium]